MSKRLEPHSPVSSIIKVPGVGILFGYGDTVPTDTTPGYATGCYWAKTNGGTNTAAYVNIGNATSCDFNNIQNS